MGLPGDSHGTPVGLPGDSRSALGVLSEDSRRTPGGLSENSRSTLGVLPEDYRRTPGGLPEDSRQSPAVINSNDPRLTLSQDSTGPYPAPSNLGIPKAFCFGLVPIFGLPYV